jgi:hypothetical protein
MPAHAEKAADGQHGIWILSIGAHEEVVDLTDRFVALVGNAAADDLGRAIAAVSFCTLTLAGSTVWARPGSAAGPKTRSAPIIAALAKIIAFV